MSKEVKPLTIPELIKEAHETAKAKGWWPDPISEGPPNFPEKLALVHEEVSEALREYRIWGVDTQIGIQGIDKPVGLAIELADAVIRILDLCGYYGIDLAEAIKVKMKYNLDRPYRHGGKRA